MHAGRVVADPFEAIDRVPVTKIDYWVDQLNDVNFDADYVAEMFFATKKESEISSTLTKITTLQDNIEKILRKEVTSNYMMFIKARDTIKQTGLEMSELRALVDKTFELIQDVRGNRLDSSETMRKSSIMGMVNMLAHTPKLGYEGVDRMRDGARARSGSDQSAYSDVDSESSSDENGESDGLKSVTNPASSSSHHIHGTGAGAGAADEISNDALPYHVPDWLARAPDELTRLIIERGYSASVKLVVRVREYAAAWAVQYNREKEAYRLAKEKNASEDALALQGLSREERKAAVSKQTLVASVMDRVEAKQQHFAEILTESVAELPHSPIWGMEEQRRRLRMLITLGHDALAAKAFSKSRMDIIQVVLRDVEASGDPKVYITDMCKGFYSRMLDVTQSFLQLFSRHAHKPSIMSILIVWGHNQTSALVKSLVQQIRLAVKEYSALAIVHLKPKMISVASASNGSASKAGTPVSGALNRAVSPPRGKESAEDSLVRERTASLLSPGGDVMNLGFDHVPVPYGPTYSLQDDLRSFVGPLQFTHDSLNIAMRQASYMNKTGLQGFADLPWLMLPHIKKLVNTYSEDLIKETINQVRIDSWFGAQPRTTVIIVPGTLLQPTALGSQAMPAPAVKQSLSQSPLPSNANEGVFLLGASFDWLTVCLSHFLDDVWRLLSIRNHHNDESDALDDADGNADGETRDIIPAEASDEELDEAGKVKYSRPAFRRVGLCEIEPIAVTTILRILLYYVVEIERLDTKSERFGSHEMRRKCLVDTCKCIREKTIPSIQAFIQKVLFGLQMVTALGHAKEGAAFGQSPQSILAEVSTKLRSIEDRISSGA